MPEGGVLEVIVTGGAGKRMWPFATVRPKATLPVGGRPLVRVMAERLKRAGIGRLVVVVDKRGGPVRAALLDLDGVETVEVTAAGSAEALRAAWALAPESAVMVVPGDALVSVDDLAAMREVADRGDAEAAVLVAPMGGEEPNRWIGVSTRDGVLTEVVGHPRESAERWTGICVFGRHFHRYLEANPGIMANVPVGGMPPAEADLSSSVQLALEHGVSIEAVPSQGGFVDLDKPWHILEANRVYGSGLFGEYDGDVVAPGASNSDGADIKGRILLQEKARIGPRVRVRGDLYVGAGSVVDNGAIIQGQVIVGPQTRVSDYCQVGHAVIGAECVVGHGAEFTGVLFDGTYLYHYCEIYGVLGCSVDIGAATVCGTLRFDDGDRVHKVAGAWERPTTGANASYLGDYSRTGVNAILMPGVRVGAYSCVGPGVVLYEDVSDRSLVLLKQELETRSWGPEKYGW